MSYLPPFRTRRANDPADEAPRLPDEPATSPALAGPPAATPDESLPPWDADDSDDIPVLTTVVEPPALALPALDLDADQLDALVDDVIDQLQPALRQAVQQALVNALGKSRN